jgi:hypothetical protein
LISDSYSQPWFNAWLFLAIIDKIQTLSAFSIVFQIINSGAATSEIKVEMV